MNGSIRGEFVMGRFVDPFLCTDDRNCLTVRFDFKDKNGECFRQSSVLSAEVLWNRGSCPTSWQPRVPFQSQISTSRMMDSGNPYRILVDEKETLTGQLSHVPAEFEVMVLPSGVMVKNHFYCGDQKEVSGHVEKGHCTVYYEFPFSYFLWRKAVELCEDDFATEALDYITLLPFGRKMNLPISAIEVKS
ncbi:MAG TPA: hypothetical protein VFZ59_12865 [Verrucomicrobiae bacterium]|nr:hypothetical protein [Verrucomicrobiae bacterium]